MNEIFGDFWSDISVYDAIVVTTNGIVKKDHTLVMGGGIAKQFADRYPVLPKILAGHVRFKGNVPRCVQLEQSGPHIISMPTKEHFKYNSPVNLVRESAVLVRELVDRNNFNHVLSVKPGCGLGGLSWEIVKPILEKAGWDNRFTIVEPY